MLETVLLDPKLLAPETIRPLSRREYDRLVAAGTFDNERVELLRGQLVTMSPQGWPHSRITSGLTAKLIRALDEGYRVLPRCPYGATDDSEPEPDISVCRERKRARNHPTSALLLIEVSESSLRKDRKVKAAIYAENGAPEYWVIDVRKRSVFVHTQPQRGTYRSIVELRGRRRLRPIRLPQFTITVDELFAL